MGTEIAMEREHRQDQAAGDQRERDSRSRRPRSDKNSFQPTERDAIWARELSRFEGLATTQLTRLSAPGGVLPDDAAGRKRQFDSAGKRLRRLEQRGYLVRAERSDVRSDIWQATGSYLGRLGYPPETGRISRMTALHEVWCAELIWALERSNPTWTITTARELQWAAKTGRPQLEATYRAGSRSRIYTPDGFAVSEGGARTAIELELAQKSARRYEAIWGALIAAGVQSIAYYTPSYPMRERIAYLAKELGMSQVTVSLWHAPGDF